MRGLFILAIAFLLTPAGYGQNLVINGGFETDSTTQWGFTKKTGWFQLHSADIFHLNVPGPFFSIDQKRPRSGKGFAGLYVGGYSVSPQNDSIASHEYLIGKLSQTLEAGKRYQVSFWARPSGTIFDPEFMFTTHQIGAAFMTDTSELSDNRISYTEIVMDEDVWNGQGVLTDWSEYVQVSRCYEAKGGEAYIVIGNLLPESLNQIEPLTPASMYQLAYFIVDDVEVIEEKQLLYQQDTLICEGESLTIIFDTTLFREISIDNQTVHSTYEITTAGIHDIQAYFGDCFIHEKLEVEIEECYDCRLFVPNTISPNGDGINDHIEVSSNCQMEIMEANVYDRWGDLVYHSNTGFDWNGESDGTLLQPGVYVYTIEVKIVTPIDISYKRLSGDITILN